MMAKPYEISLVSNTRQLNADLKRSADAVDDISDALDDMAKEGDDSGEKLERSFKDAARAAERAGDDVGDGFGRGTRRMADQSREVGDEIRQNLGEGIANAARGDFESLGDTVGDTLGGITAGIGGIGTAALGVAGAAGIGAIVAAVDLANQKTELAKQKAAEWADVYIESGGRILSATQVFEKAREIITDPEMYAEARKNAHDWGVSEATALLAMSGDTNALAEARDNLASKEERLAELVEQGGSARGNLREETNQLSAETREGAASMDLLTQAQDAGAKQADIYSESLRLTAENTAGASTKIDEFGDKVTTLPDGTVIYIDAETGQATQDTDAIEKKIYGIQDQTVTIGADTSPADQALIDLQRRARNIDLTVTVNQRRGTQVI